MNILEGKVKEKLRSKEPFHQLVTAVAYGRKRALVAAGYNDGSVMVYEVRTGEAVHTFSFHTSAVTVLTFDSEATFPSHLAGIPPLQRQ